MVLALSGAEAGKEFLASPKLLGVLLELLPMGSPRCLLYTSPSPRDS